MVTEEYSDKEEATCKLYAVSKSIATGGYTLEDWFLKYRGAVMVT